IMLRTDGYIKVLDFGLAKLAEPKAAESIAPSLPRVDTEPGMIMGTVNYMSPEQARGLATDAGTDIWSLGVVIYEMVTGCRPFEGETASDVIALILQKEPLALTQYSTEIPAELDRIVGKALSKDKKERYQFVKDLLTDLKSLATEAPHLMSVVPRGKVGRHLHPTLGKTRYERNWKIRTIGVSLAILALGLGIIAWRL